MRSWLPLVLFVPCIASGVVAGEAPVADQPPLGVVESVADGIVALRFDAAVALAPGSVVAIYGPGTVEKHPLTKQVIVERRAEIAKAQVLDHAAGVHRARLAWLAGVPTKPAAIEAGMDAVPVPGAAPNAPPVVGEIAAVGATLQDAALIQVPVSDADGDAVRTTWSIDGPAGRCGRLTARTTAGGDQGWIAPGTPVTATLRGVVRDALGQESAFAVPLTAGPLGDDWRKRELKPFERFAGEPRPITALVRDARGAWWGADARGAVVRIAAGWTQERDVSFAKDSAPGRPVALVPRADLLWVLDADAREAVAYGPDFAPKRRVGGLDAPTDLAIDALGVLYIADQGLGGVQVHEPDGRLRCRLGQAGDGKDDFAALTRIDLAADGTLLALDARRRRVHRWDRAMRRLGTWDVPTDDKNPPVDVAAHPRGTLVLLASGKVLVTDAAGSAGASLPSLAQARMADDTGPAHSIAVDGDEIYATYPESSLVMRYAADGQPSGVRGGALAIGLKHAVDGRGRLLTLDEGTQTVRRFDAEGFRTGRFGGNARSGGVLVNAADLCVQPDGASFAVLDGKKQFVARFTGDAADEKPLVFAQPGRNNGQLGEAVGVAMDEAGRIYVLDLDLHRVAVFAADGGFLFNVGHYEKGKQPDELVEPALIAVAPAGDALYVYDADSYELKKFALDQAARSGSHVTNAGGKGDGLGQLRKPIGIGCDRIGLLYVCDAGRGDVQLLDFRGSNAVPVFARKAVDLGVKSPIGFCVSPDGQCYLTDGTRIIGARW
ncbi:MAG TPA: NHL repeat-containing protein [Planctomycetota bacterium]|nr:NHL repeat-containing protein [Planctomycetota bacterium]